MKVLSYMLLFIFPVIIFVVSLFVYSSALNSTIDASAINGELLENFQNMLLSLTHVLWLIAFSELCAAGFIACVIYTLKSTKGKKQE